MMSDPRVGAYGQLLVDYAADVQPGWQVIVYGQPLARPLLDEVLRRIAERRAYALLRLGFDWPPSISWLKHAREELVGVLAPLEVHELEHADARIAISAPANKHDGADLAPERRARWVEARREPTKAYGFEKPLILCQYPTNALAQEAGMTLREFEDILYGAVLIDWDALDAELRRVAVRFDATDEVRIVGSGTDLTLSLANRRGEVDAGKANIPGGEVFYSPVEDSAQGVIDFSEFPACYGGHAVEGVRLRFEAGRVVEASARSDEGFLLRTLDADEGARRVGELGIGCNPGIQRHLKNTLFDEKIAGTVHLALGESFSELGGANRSGVHWDIVKDLRQGGELWCDGELVQRDGRWLL